MTLYTTTVDPAHRDHTLPTWVRNHLIASGHLDENGNGRRARPRRCRHCRTVVLAGYDADLCARLVTCDPRPLSALGEALALTDGRYTRELRTTGGRLELDQRDHWQITGHPAGAPGNRFDVLAQHRCGAPIPTAWTAPAWKPAVRLEEVYAGAAPF